MGSLQVEETSAYCTANHRASASNYQLSNMKVGGEEPPEYVLVGNNKERVTYDQLTMGQWVAGFCRTMRDESDKNCKEAMLTYLISLLDDANDFSWSAARACHTVLLCRMKQGEIKDFTQTEAIDRVRRAHAQRHVSQSSQNQSKNAFKREKNSKSMPCQFFNQGTCMHTSTHETRGVLYHHICSSCKWQSLPSFRGRLQKQTQKFKKTSKAGSKSTHWHIFLSKISLE